MPEKEDERAKAYLQMKTLNTTSFLPSREVCQVLTDVALGNRIMTRSSIPSWNETYHGLMPVEIDGWLLTLFNDCDTLDYCEHCRSPNGRGGALKSWQLETELSRSTSCLARSALDSLSALPCFQGCHVSMPRNGMLSYMTIDRMGLSQR